MKGVRALIILGMTLLCSPPVFGVRPNAVHSGETPRYYCSYSIEIETSCAPSAETSDPISARFGDSAGNEVVVQHLENPKPLYAPKGGVKQQKGAYTGLQRCVVDVFEASGACMSTWICSLYLRKYGSDEWRPGWVKVVHRQNNGETVPVSYMFYFRTFVPANVWYGFNYCDSQGGFIPHVATFGSGN